MGSKTHICGSYKGYRIIQEYEQIGNNVYSDFYIEKKKGERYYRVKNVTARTLQDILKCVDNRIKEIGT